jgi:hypothetical protein
MDTELNIKIGTKNDREFVRRVSKVFARKVRNDLHLYEDDICHYVDTCVNNAVRHVSVENAVGKYMKVSPIDCKSSCIMCFQPFNSGEFKRILPCSHFFHKKCIDKWLFSYNHDSCPCCRKSVT